MLALTLFAAVAAAPDARDAVVFLEQGSSACAGTLIDAEGTVLTAYHCVMSGGRPRVTTRAGDVAIGRVVALSRQHDLAVVATDLTDRPFLPVRESAPEPEEPVRVIGHPMGANEPGGFLAGLLRWSVSTGIVSAVGPRAIQVTAPINRGNSGGPVLDADDRVIGVVSRRITGDGLGFAGRVDALPEGGSLLSPGGKVEVRSVLQTTGAPIALGLALNVELRDRIVLSGIVAAPLGLRWQAWTSGEAVHQPWEVHAALRQRVFRGPFALRLDAYAGVGGVDTVSFDGDRFRYASEVVPVVGGRAAVRAVAFSYGVALAETPAFLARVELAFPGTLFML
ncbi:MAG: trypsin-like peptidase domain-containing protein [Alphaproteobacteria bacterium]|nr:trypsin-like peptidase domain-containing protein [Alphaproteobacteria bacterium]